MSLEERMEEVKGLTTRYIKSIAMDIAVVIVALAYIFYKMITLKPTELNPLVLLAGAVVSIICGVVIKQALGENGFSRGYNSKTWADEEDKYNDACNTANPYMDRVDNFYQCEEIDRKKRYRRTKLQEAHLKYNQWFDGEGNYIGTKEMESKLEKKQKRVLNKCIRVKIYPLNLFSQYNISVDQDTKKEVTDAKQRGRNITKNTISASLIAIVGVYFIPQIKGWNWGDFISATMQVSMWVIFGIIQLYINFNFVVQDRVAVLRKKKETIKRFTAGCEKGLYEHSPYDELDKRDNLIELIGNAPVLANTQETNECKSDV